MYGNQKFFVCKQCGNLIGMIDNKGVPLVCCGETMTGLVPNTVDAAHEKHVPVVKKAEECTCGCKCGSALIVEIGNTHHPMQEDHTFTSTKQRLWHYRTISTICSKRVGRQIGVILRK